MESPDIKKEDVLLKFLVNFLPAKSYEDPNKITGRIENICNVGLIIR